MLSKGVFLQLTATLSEHFFCFFHQKNKNYRVIIFFSDRNYEIEMRFCCMLGLPGWSSSLRVWIYIVYRIYFSLRATQRKRWRMNKTCSQFQSTFMRSQIPEQRSGPPPHLRNINYDTIWMCFLSKSISNTYRRSSISFLSVMFHHICNRSNNQVRYERCHSRQGTGRGLSGRYEKSCVPFVLSVYDLSSTVQIVHRAAGVDALYWNSKQNVTSSFKTSDLQLLV